MLEVCPNMHTEPLGKSGRLNQFQAFKGISVQLEITTKLIKQWLYLSKNTNFTELVLKRY